MKANQLILNLQSDLQISWVGAKTYKANYNTKVACLQLENSDLQSALGALQTKVTEDKRRLTLGITDFTQWMCDNCINADTIISVPDPSTSSSDIHHMLAHNALVNVCLGNWSSAYEDAQKVIPYSLIAVLVYTHLPLESIVTWPSAMAHIVKALAQIRMGDTKQALQLFDLAFRNCHPKESNLLLLIKACDPCVSLT